MCHDAPEPPDDAQLNLSKRADADAPDRERFERLLAGASPQLDDPAHDNTAGEDRGPRDTRSLRHGQPFMAAAVFDFGRRNQEPSPPPPTRAPCPLCGEPCRLKHAYCARCGYRLPWAASVEGLPEVAPRFGRLDRAIENNLALPQARCRFCNKTIEAYDRRCPHCRRWLISGWHEAELDSWQPDFDRWNLSQVRGFKASGCFSPVVLTLALIVWRVLA